tara:strand:- start:173 stop:1810 length:1638 start_codon:yes stop_codon:yes gene_type:complete
MKLERPTYQKPLSLTGLGGGATSLNFAGAAGDSYFVATLNSYNPPYYMNETVYDLAIGSDGSIYGCGYTQISGCGDTSFVFKYNKSGVLQWQRYLCNNGSFSGMGLDSSDNVYVGGYGSSGGYKGIIVKYNSSGVLQWQKTISHSSHYIFIQGAGVDSSGNAYVAGYMRLANTSPSENRLLVAKYNSSGVQQWLRVFGAYRSATYGGGEVSSNYKIECYGMHVDSSGNIYTTGQMNATQMSSDWKGVHVAKINSSGTPQWSRFLRHPSQTGVGFGIYSTGGSVYFCGGGTSPATINQGTDSFVASLYSDGSYGWMNFFGNTTSSDEAKDVVVDSSGYIYVTGYHGTYGNNYSSAPLMKFASSPPYSSAAHAKYQNGRQTVDAGGWKHSFRNFYPYDSEYQATYGNAITLDSDENIYFGGHSTNGTQNYNVSQSNNGHRDGEIYIAKVPNDGTLTGNYSYGPNSTGGSATDVFRYEADGTNSYDINDYYHDVNQSSPYQGHYLPSNIFSSTDHTLQDQSSSYSFTSSTSTFTDAATSLTSALTLLE